MPLVNKSGVLLNSPRLFLRALQGIIDSTIAFSYVFKRFDSISLLNERYPNPNPDMSAIITDVGLVIFKESIASWVLASDDVTVIT